MEHVYNAERIWITSVDGTKIDTMFLKGNNSSSNTTVLFCNPNAGYYEYTYDFQGQWLDFYTEKGINMLLWNYRGFNESQGIANFESLLLDGESIVNYLREERKVDKLILHGESLGGTIASNLAFKLKADFLFADRTFGNIEEVAALNFAKFGKRLFRFVTGWNIDSTDSYLKTTCYKVIWYDPNDTIIHERSEERRVGKE